MAFQAIYQLQKVPRESEPPPGRHLELCRKSYISCRDYFCQIVNYGEGILKHRPAINEYSSARTRGAQLSAGYTVNTHKMLARYTTAASQSDSTHAAESWEKLLI